MALPPYSLLFLTGGAGFLYFFQNLITNNLKLKKYSFSFLFLILILFFILLISMMMNQIVDFYFLKEIILYSLFSYFSALFVVVLLDKTTNDDDLIQNFVYVVVFQLLISFICYMVPSLFDLVFSIFSRSDVDTKIINLNEVRLVGLGAAFFGSGIVNSFTLILIAALLKKEKNKVKLMLLLFSFIIIASIGIMSSRTTIIGILISIFLILLNFNLLIKTIKYFFLIVPVIAVSLIFIPNSERFTDLLNFGFDFLFNYKDSQASNSAGELMDMWQVIPSGIRTLLYGDVLLRTDNGYYMDTDVGYFRIIYSVGLFGLFVFCFIHCYMILKIKNEYIGWIEKIGFLFVFFILNIKGIANLIPFLSLFYIFSGIKGRK
ncbi:hypothetical protein [Acinetobacter wuhouensis]|uniref:hypothetical protein n=1 Tax=Acinetobacter wuhouensis TaxID=1879050 RepID=UPI00126034D9|nr:hypothetical protein [Acinetobacter wuhouensis]